MKLIQGQIETLLARTNLKVSFDEFLKSVEENFGSLGKIEKYFPINEGYEDANFLLETDKGRFVLKMFLAERTKGSVNSYVRILEECKSIDVPTIEMLTDFNDGLGFFGKGDPTYYIVTKFFEGENFQDNTPTVDEIVLFTSFLSQLNTLDFEVEETYDSWGNKNFGKEYEKRKHNLTKEQNLLIKPIYDEFIQIPLGAFSKSVIHGDLQRKHILKNKDGKYCLLDFGCMAYDPKVIELSTYLAWFALQEDTWPKKDEIYKKVVDTYLKTHSLTSEELESLPVLVKSSYASYYMVTSCLINDGDNSQETLEWNNFARKMLNLFDNFEG